MCPIDTGKNEYTVTFSCTVSLLVFERYERYERLKPEEL